MSISVEMDEDEQSEERVEEQNHTEWTIRGHSITKNEVHAVTIGLGIGLFSFIPYGIFISGLCIIYAVFGNPVLRSQVHTDTSYKDTVGTETIRFEPWYFVSGVIVMTLISLFIGI